jgi:tetratricopeptide (TPR) repeat protein
MRRTLIIALGLLACSIQPLSAAGTGAPGAQTPASPPAVPAAPTAPGEVIDNGRQYRHCIALARQTPQEGWEEALAWTSLGGGDPARHCAAIALIGLRQLEEGALRLEDLAQSSHGAPTLRAGMLAQAGQAWLLAKNPERAYADQTAALALVPGAPDLLVDRAESLAEAKNYKDALADLDQAIAATPDRVDALTFRAAAKRYLDDLQGAAADIDQALKIDPLYQDAWLERGMVKRLTGDDAGARQAWLKVLELAPTSAAADTARRNIELMDVKER